MTAYNQLLEHVKQARLLESVAALAGWDQHTYMPAKGAGLRADQLGLLAKLTHGMLTDPRIGDALHRATVETAGEPGDSVRGANVREIQRAYDRAVKLPARLVEEIAKTTSQAQNIWAEARKQNDPAPFLPWLDRILKLKREEAQVVGYCESPYDALLDEYEPGATAREITALFAMLRHALSPLVDLIAGASKKPRTDILNREYALDRQRGLAEAVGAAIGFDFGAGRLDTSVHPFCSGFGPGDVRLTTRYRSNDFVDGFFGVLHEAGHGMYEQGLDPAHFGTPAGTAVSLGIHESQSRLWENAVGRSRPFWEHFFPRTRQAFPGVLDDVTLEDFLFSLNTVEKSYIRVEADEATYNLHIILRFELEQDMIAGKLDAKDVPEAWNTRFHAMFGLTPPTPALGCLQDVHWSMGGLGYFPTYALGNMYAAQFMHTARQQLPGLDDDFRRGEFSRLRGWLRDNIHLPGSRRRPRDLCQHVTGQPLSHEPLIHDLRTKYTELYSL
jgi:carboxypeptidase Taq